MKEECGESLSLLLVAVVVLTLALFFTYRWGYAGGVNAEQATWEKKEQAYKDAEIQARKDHAKNLLDKVGAQQKINLKNTEDHEAILEKVHADLAAARAESKRLGGLRISAAACPRSNPWAGAQAASASQRDEETSTTIALPEAVETRLWTIVGEADEILEQARACQAWIIDNGFYGKIPAPAD